MGRATDNERFEGCTVGISIHALRGEGDEQENARPAEIVNFNPRPPWGGRRYSVNRVTKTFGDFNPRPPWGGRLAQSDMNLDALAFQSTPSVGRATKNPTIATVNADDFNPRPPWGGRLWG